MLSEPACDCDQSRSSHRTAYRYARWSRSAGDDKPLTQTKAPTTSQENSERSSSRPRERGHWRQGRAEERDIGQDEEFGKSENEVEASL